MMILLVMVQVPTNNINTLTTLDVSNSNISDLTGIEDFLAIETLNFNDNNVSTLDVSNNTALRILRLRNNSVSTIDVSANEDLFELLIENNGLTSLDLSTNVALSKLYAGGNYLTSVDLSNNSALSIIGLNVNNLTNLNIKNGNNTNITTFVIGDNPLLTCVLVDDATYSTTNWTNIDAQTNFSDTECNLYTAIPDSNFEAALGVLGYDDIADDGKVPTASITPLTSLSCTQ